MKKLSLCGSDWSLIYVKNSIFKKNGEVAEPFALKKLGYPETVRYEK